MPHYMALVPTTRSTPAPTEPQPVTVTRRVPPPTPAKSRAVYLAALAAAGLSDALSIGVEFLPPVQIAIDLATALVIWALLGWRWTMLVALVAEAIPGLALFPTWLLVVLAYGAFPKKPAGIST